MDQNKQKFYKKWGIIVLSVATVIGAGWYWWYSAHYVSTDDAYVGANVVQIIPRVSGQVLQLHVVNNQYVKKDQPLFDLDPALYQIAVEKAQAQLAIDQAKLVDQQVTTTRILELVKTAAMSKQDGDNAQANLDEANAAVALSKATLAEAQLNLQYTQVTATTSGWLSNVTVRVGDNLQNNGGVFALVSDQEFWIDTNFKETQMQHIKDGQPATIVVDMYPSKEFAGVVESISPASGNAFSLLPPQNATGNWVKITQRVPVRVRVLKPDPNYPLRVGTSSTVTISIRPEKKD
jgi:membrane fusion protein (multidrug efflux system)